MNGQSNPCRRSSRIRLLAIGGLGMKILALATLLLAFGCVECGTRDAADPEYGAIFKKTRRDRVRGTEFWGSRTDKDCTPGASGGEVCLPRGHFRVDQLNFAGEVRNLRCNCH